MPKRLLVIDAPAGSPASTVLGDYADASWPSGPGRSCLQVVVPGSAVDATLDALRAVPDVAVAVVPVEAIVRGDRGGGGPRPPTPLEVFLTRDRLSTEELTDDVEEGTRLTRAFLGMAVASAIIAGLGMRSGQTAVVIGAMVIAPLLGPCMALAMAATVGDRALGQRAALALVGGAGAAYGATVVLGALVAVDPSAPELAARTSAGPADVALALASGVAGVLAFCRGLSASLVGVMIAVALVPPLAAAGMLGGAALAGRGGGEAAVGALLLFATNLVCINVAGIATFLLQGLPPKDWRLTGRVLAVWVALLAALGTLLTLRVAG